MRKAELFFAVPGYDVTSYDYLLKLSRREAPLTDKINIINFAIVRATCIRHGGNCSDTILDLDRYLANRGDAQDQDLGRLGSRTRSSARTNPAPARRTGLKFKDHTAAGKGDRLARSHVARLALLKVMYENDIDVFVHPENTVPTPKIQGPNVGTSSLDGITPFFQIPRDRRAGRCDRCRL